MWGVVGIEKCFPNFEIVIESAVSEILQFVRFYVIYSISRENQKYKAQVWNGGNEASKSHLGSR